MHWSSWLTTLNSTWTQQFCIVSSSWCNCTVSSIFVLYCCTVSSIALHRLLLYCIIVLCPLFLYCATVLYPLFLYCTIVLYPQLYPLFSGSIKLDNCYILVIGGPPFGLNKAELDHNSLVIGYIVTIIHTHHTLYNARCSEVWVRVQYLS